MYEWSNEEIPDQSGKVVLVTGATNGIGYETARVLAGKGATVLLCARSDANGRRAAARLLDRSPRADIRLLRLDLADLDSVEAAAQTVSANYFSLDILINNAGISSPPQRQVTKNGYELQFGVNYLGHYALTARLLPCLLHAAQPRVVSLSSVGHRVAPIDFDDLQCERKYTPGTAYGKSKLALLMFAQELQRLSDANGWPLLSIPVHPGLARSNLLKSGPSIGRDGGRRGLFPGLFEILIKLIGQSTAAGALPTLFAAAAPEAVGGQYYGPSGWGELTGSPAPARVGPYAQDRAAQTRLWDISSQLSGVCWRLESGHVPVQ